MYEPVFAAAASISSQVAPLSRDSSGFTVAIALQSSTAVHCSLMSAPTANCSPPLGKITVTCGAVTSVLENVAAIVWLACTSVNV
jgi:hypothetical protein